MKLTVKLCNELKVLDSIALEYGITFTEALQKTGMHRKTFWAALKRLQGKGIVEKYSWGRKKIYNLNIPMTQVYLFKLRKLGLGTKYNQDYFFERKIMREQLLIAKDILALIDFFGFRTIKKWHCPTFEHRREKLVYCLTDFGIMVYCGELGCKNGVYRSFTRYLNKEQPTDYVQVTLERRRVDAVKNKSLSENPENLNYNLKVILESPQFQTFCEYKCPMKDNYCKNYCPFFCFKAAN